MRKPDSGRTFTSFCHSEEPEECRACKQKASVAAQLREQLGKGQIARKDDPRGEIKLTQQEIDSLRGVTAEEDCSAVCPEVKTHGW